MNHSQSEATSDHHACNEIKAQLKEALEKLKVSDDKLKAVEIEFQEFRDDAQQAVDESIARCPEREKEMYRRFQAWETPSKTIPIFGSPEQALANARAEVETTKGALLTTKQDLGNNDHEVSILKYRSETWEKELLRRDRSEKTRGRSLGRSDDEDEDSYSLSGRTSRGLGHSRK